MRSILKSLKQLALGLFLIVIISAVLILTDKTPKTFEKKKTVIKAAYMIYSSRSVLEDTMHGCIDSLAQRGYIEGKTITIRKYNSENDIANANTIAQEIVNSDFKMVMTASTPCLQIVANANKNGKVFHVFATVTDPYGAGVGIDSVNHNIHPKHLVGIGTFQPVEEAFRIAKKMYPDLKVVGTPWSSGEACAQACVAKARAICKELGITLMENTVQNSNEIIEASRTLVAKGVQALWVGGDNAVELALSVVVKAGEEGRIPVFANAPEHAEKGAIFGLGANYYEVGKAQGKMAADILEGKDSSKIFVENIVPQKLFINKTTLKKLKDPWIIPDEIQKRTDKFFDDESVESKVKK